MIHRTSFVSLVMMCLLSTAAFAGDELDQRIVGKWEGMREPGGKCQFLAWTSNFMADGRFEIVFFSDKERLTKIQAERGAWTASNGRNVLRTDGVPTAEAYLYTLIDDNTIKYVNTVTDPSADCQADYEFTEHRVSK